jgi:hypothetical protein
MPDMTRPQPGQNAAISGIGEAQSGQDTGMGMEAFIFRAHDRAHYQAKIAPNGKLKRRLLA